MRCCSFNGGIGMIIFSIADLVRLGKAVLLSRDEKSKFMQK